MTFCSERHDIPDEAGRVTRRRTQAISKRFAFNTNAIKMIYYAMKKHGQVYELVDIIKDLFIVYRNTCVCPFQCFTLLEDTFLFVSHFLKLYE